MTPSLHSNRGDVFPIEYDPDIPNLITSGSTLSQAFDHACEALDLQALDKLGRPQPEPRHRLVLESAGSA